MSAIAWNRLWAPEQALWTVRTGPCEHCYCLDAPVREGRERSHVRCCKCGDEHLRGATGRKR